MPSNAIYLDYAAATPLDPRVFKAMQPFLGPAFYNPSASYTAALAVKDQLEAARATTANLIGAKASSIIFTAGGTEANNLAIQGVLKAVPGSNLVVSSIEHESVLRPAEMFEHKFAAVNREGLVDIESLIKLIDKQTVMVSVMYANNEVGTIQPLAKIAQALEPIRKQRLLAKNPRPLYLHSDACQAAELLDLHVSRLGVDLMSLNGGKIYGPKQSGALFIDRRVRLQPIILGGGQEHNRRSGTENIAGTIGFSEALKIAQSQKDTETSRLAVLQKLFLALIKQKLPTAEINGSLKHRLASNVHLTIPGVNNERLLIKLDQAGIMAAAGSACSASNEASSHVLLAMGLSDDSARSSLRFSLGRATTEADIKKTVAILSELV